MKEKRKPKSKSERQAARKHRHEAGGGVIGALGGAGMGALVAGPPGAAAGAVIGAAVGTLSAWAADANAEDLAATERRLDAEIGVSEGDLGVPGLAHPPAKIGALSAESSGAGGSTSTTLSGGPILPPPD